MSGYDNVVGVCKAQTVHMRCTYEVVVVSVALTGGNIDVLRRTVLAMFAACALKAIRRGLFCILRPATDLRACFMLGSGGVAVV